MNKYLKIKNYTTKLKSIFSRSYSVTYSQNGEDIIMWNLSRSLGLVKPSYIDIGAFHPQKLSNTYLFYKNGSTGINIEPNKNVTNLFKKIRPKDTNLSLAISSKRGDAKYYIMDTPTLNTLSKEEADYYVKMGHRIISEYLVETKTLDQIIKTYCNNTFPDILSVDAEGYDIEILETIDWEKNTPKIICIETSRYHKEYAHEKDDALISWIKSKGYIIHADTYINTIFIKNNA